MGPWWPTGRSPRTLVGPDGAAEEIDLLRGRCLNKSCPVCTVTHSPSFMTPYHPVPTAKREAVIRARAGGEVARTTARRWCAMVEAQATEVWTGLTVIRYPWIRRHRPRLAKQSLLAQRYG